MFKRLLNKMGLVDKVKVKETKQIDAEVLNGKEAAFVITKLRQASYQGTEFETFYQIMAKLQLIVENKQK